MIGPFLAPPFAPYRVSPIGVATRKYSGKKRLIIDLSAPHDGVVPSINSLIPREPFSLYHASVDNAISMIKTAGRGAWLGKADITDAFKVMPLHPSQWHLFGVRWGSKLNFSVRLAFGCRSSPRIFDSLSEALCWILVNVHRLPFVLHLLDDFLVVDFPSSPPARCISVLRDTFGDLGVPLSAEKTVGLFTSLEFLGINLDSVSMQALLPAEKLERVRSVLKAALGAASMAKRELLSLLGHLYFAMRIIPQGRAFVSRLLDLAKSVPHLQDCVVLDDGCRSDLRFWSVLCEHWNGISFFYHDSLESSVALDFYTDAAPSVGFGGFHGVPNAAPSRVTGRVGVSAIPPDVHCFESQKLHPSSIKALVSGIQFNVRCSEPSACSLLGNPSIRLLMNGLRKQRPETKDKRLPITLPLLHTLVSNLRQGCFGPYVDTLLESVFFTAFYGFLRRGDIVEDKWRVSPYQEDSWLSSPLKCHLRLRPGRRIDAASTAADPSGTAE
ncbi:uncharacterized protein LOC124477894 [Hypomesus transpacificus]|uniref:uncharacterized protein LOC124477894 n=1 Tax=Hypomesus transpacificus TaxID=137520 RepID=UPI001F07AEC8|nr:uncharacterized protein LOC124477894 [Hypomesus transpacificus]